MGIPIHVVANHVFDARILFYVFTNEMKFCVTFLNSSCQRKEDEEEEVDGREERERKKNVEPFKQTS